MCTSALLLLKPHRSRQGRNIPATATLFSKFQISIPKTVREKQHWEAGQEFVFIPKGKGVLVMPMPTLDQLAGLAEGASGDGYRDRDDRF